MSKSILLTFLAVCLALSACAGVASTPATPTIDLSPTAYLLPTDTPSPIPSTDTASPIPPTEIPSPTLTQTPVPTVESLKATVATNLLSCRYGPGPNYLYLDGLREGLKLILVGQTGGNNWVWVQGTKNNCWVHSKFLTIEGNFKTLPIVYPEPARLPVSAYYSPSVVLSATREGNTVTITWLGVPISPGDYEKPDMFNYIVEVWRCEGGQFIFDPLPTNRETISFIDEPGCAQTSHGRVFVQEKHGYAGPAEIPWP